MKVFQINRKVSKVMNVPIDQIKKKGTRHPDNVNSRYIVWDLINYFNLDYTVKQVGKMFGYDHSSVCDGRKALRDKLKYDTELRQKYNLIREQLKEVA